jgi:hypothetical protein
MKQKFSFFTLAILIAILSFSSCNSQDNSPKGLVDEFYEAYNLEDFVAIKLQANAQIADLMKDLVENHYENYGEILSWEQYKSKDFSNDNNEGVILNYKCKYKKNEDDIFVKFIITKDEDEYKIAAFTFNKNQDIIDNFDENYEKAKEIGATYYEYLLNGKFNKITELLDEERIIKPEYEDMFFGFIENRQEYFGKVTSYSINNYSTEVQENLPVFVIIYDCVTDNGEIVEELSFIKRGNEFKIIDYRYAESLDYLMNM